MIDIVDKHNCCGCAACAQCCPKHCITMLADEEGFAYPQVNPQECVNCGLCDKVCPISNTLERNAEQPIVYAAKNSDDDIRALSSSGGLFFSIAYAIIKQGGVVFGTVFNNDWSAEIVYAETIDGVYPMMGSKYVQAKIETSFIDVRKFLKEGRKVLFAGTPCQVAALNSFLKHEKYDNLLTVDFLCHGVPSSGVWHKYLNERFLTPKAKITDIRFRDKGKGWRNFHLLVQSELVDGRCSEYIAHHKRDAYMRGFLKNIYLRPSCYNCKFKCDTGVSDVTLGDFWHIEKYDSQFSDDKGVSIILVNTEAGQQMLKSINVKLKQSSFEIARSTNRGFNIHKPHSKRALFYKLINERGYTVEKAVEECLNVSAFDHLRARVHKLLRVLKVRVGK